MSGQWIALDANYYFSPLAVRLSERFGWAGVALWPAFLCACKKAPTPGTLTFGSDAEAMNLMGVRDLELVDNAGLPFDLKAFWTLTGQLKQTKRTRRGQLLNVTSTHYGRWQDDARIDKERERKRRWWHENRVEATSSGPLALAAKLAPDNDNDNDIPPPTSSASSNGTRPAPDRGGGNSAMTNGDRPPPTHDELIAAATEILADERLAEVQAAAAAGQRPPVRNRKAWLSKTAEEIRTTELEALTEAQARLPAGAGPELIVNTWRRLPALRANDRAAATQAELAARDAVPQSDDGAARVAAAKAALGGEGV